MGARITPQDVRDAYRATGAFPAVAGATPLSGTPPLDVLVRARTGRPLRELACGNGATALEAAAGALGLSPLYLVGFLRGLAAAPAPPIRQPEARDGWDDGCRVAAFLWGGEGEVW